MIHVKRLSKRTPSADSARAHPSHLFRLATLTTLSALLSGCIINLDGNSPGSSSGGGSSPAGSGSGMSDGSGPGPSAPSVNRLPPPDIWRLELPLLDADKQKKFDEVALSLFDQYQALGFQIMATTQGYSGDVFDWVSPDSVEGSQIEPPPAPTPEEMQLPDGAERALTELEVYPELRGPEGTIPILRPSFWAYILGDSGATSLDDWISNYQVVGAPFSQHRLYAGMITHAPN